MSIEFIKNENTLLLQYSPFNGCDGIRQKIAEDGYFNVKYCFCFSESDLVEDLSEELMNEYEDTLRFKVATLIGEYYLFSKEILSTNNDVYIHKDIKIIIKMFVAQERISIMRKINNLVSEDIYIGNVDDKKVNLPINEFMSMISTFPNTYELKKYANVRISNILRNFFDGLGNLEIEFNRYIDKKTPHSHATLYTDIKPLQKEILTVTLDKFENMLANCDVYTEKDWQEFINDIIRIVFPKYIFSRRECNVGDDGRHNKKPDFIIVDVNGFVDILEIKKPNKIKLLTNGEYRNNHVPDRDLTGAIVQIEKYLYILNTECKPKENLEKSLSKEMKMDTPIRVMNPQGFLIMGRSDDLTENQKYDFEIIKRQYKNIVDIITYDDLLKRLKNMLLALEL